VEYPRISTSSSTLLWELPWYPIALKYIPTHYEQCTCRYVIEEWFMPHYLKSKPDWRSSCSPALSPGKWWCTMHRPPDNTKQDLRLAGTYVIWSVIRTPINQTSPACLVSFDVPSHSSEKQRLTGRNGEGKYSLLADN
jgi:hypothetical protein